MRRARRLVLLSPLCLLLASSAAADPSDLPALDALALDRAAAFAGADYAHTDAHDALVLRAGARLPLARTGFLEAEIFVADARPGGALAFGNATLRAGLLFPDATPTHLAALALQLAAPLSPRLGPGALTAQIAAAPRIGDPEAFLPDTTSAELLAAWRWRHPAWWVQLEAGTALWHAPDAPTAAVLRGTAAGGVPVTPWLDLAASFVTRIFVASNAAGDAGQDALSALALGIIVHDDGREITLRLEVPVDRPERDDDRFLVGLAIRGW